MKKIVIFDLDGTLAIIDKRREMSLKSGKMDWDVFFDPENVLTLDEPNQPVRYLYNLLCQKVKYDVYIISGRCFSTKVATLEWLKRNGFFDPKELIMRPEGCYTPDHILKLGWLKLLGKNRVEMVFDDRDSVVKMWRDEGLTCFQVAEGDF